MDACSAIAPLHPGPRWPLAVRTPASPAHALTVAGKARSCLEGDWRTRGGVCQACVRWLPVGARTTYAPPSSGGSRHSGTKPECGLESMTSLIPLPSRIGWPGIKRAVAIKSFRESRQTSPWQIVRPTDRLGDD